jgi:hypothetical protein
MTTLTAPANSRDLEPGWSFDRDTPAGPSYCRYVPGKGMLKVIAQDSDRGEYAWCLSTSPARSLMRPWESLTVPREGFIRPQDAMLDADQRISRLSPRMFEPLTPGEARELFRRLTEAHNWPGDGHLDLDKARNELSVQIRIHAADPAYRGPDPHEFIQAVFQASYGASEQAMNVSPNRGSRLPRRVPIWRATADFPARPASPVLISPAQRGARRATQHTSRPALGRGK